jgi:hypothetical protein
MLTVQTGVAIGGKGKKDVTGRVMASMTNH